MRLVAALIWFAVWLGPGVAMSVEAPPAAPASGLSIELRDKFVAALGAFKSGDWHAASSAFGDAEWTSTPLSDYALLYQAQSLFSAGDSARARAAAQRAGGTGPEGRLAPSALLQVANVLSSAGDYTAAVRLYRDFLARHGAHPAASSGRLGLAQALSADGHAAEAARVLTEIWILSPASIEAESAARQLRIRADGGLAGPAATARERVDRAERLRAAGRNDTAKAEAEALLANGLSPDLRARAFKVVFEVARRAGRHDAALATVNRALASLPSDLRPAWLLEMARLQRRRDRDQALATLDKLTREYPTSSESAEALFMKGQLLEDAAKAAEAQLVYRKLVADYPEQDEAAAGLWRLGWLAWLRGGYAEAVATWSRISSMRAGQSYREASSYWIARADEMRGEPGSAARRFAQIQADAPRSYYGILAARRGGRDTPPAPPGGAAPLGLPADPLEGFQGDGDYARIEALRAVGLDVFADEEMADLARRAFNEPKLLYAVSAAYAREARYHLALRILRRHFQVVARTGDPATPRAFWEIYYPIGWRSEMAEAAGRASIDPLLVAAVVREESSYYPRARSRAGALGLMQLMPDTARALSRARRSGPEAVDLLYDPAANLDLGSGYLAGLLRAFGDARLAVAAYNAGPTRVREWWAGRRSDDHDVWVELIPYDETRAFVKRVMLSWDEYRRLYSVPAAEPIASEDQSRRP